ncbi:CbtB-domain containing protein [Tsukamurella sp. 1534]|uniref:CbtB domain-containing protein n=1 Tax=Tsukamurella sp. 1534 TaxID=1151061 RepID=UPI0002E306EF|nr:CbtB-domain containing protein [Tsukamurella sp. 1534]
MANTTTAHAGDLSLHLSRRAVTLCAALISAVLGYYFIGIDQGAVSVFGNDTHIHEFFHDARHFLGFPCH